ncbi:MAG: MBL fold metallo-hydrolase [bacterium]
MNHQHIHWLGHSTFRIEDGATQIYIDPYKVPAAMPAADFIFITHAHYDHFSMVDIAKIRKDSTVFVAPKDVAYQIKANAVIGVVPGEMHSIAELKVKTVPAYNIGKQFHPKQSHWVGYIIALSTEQKIYHAGDTDAIPEMKTIVTDFALLPIGGKYTMMAREAAEIANHFKPAALIPMHWGDVIGTQQDAEEVKKLFHGTTIIKTSER